MIIKIKYFLIYLLFQLPRIWLYEIFSKKTEGKKRFKNVQPILFAGKGLIDIGYSTLGVQKSPFFYNGYIYIEARNKQSLIVIGNNCFINNNCTIICEGEEIIIGDNVLIGTNVEIYDSDFHDIDPENRIGGIIKTSNVKIEHNVFIGSNVKIMKGCSIGTNSVIANGSLVTKSIPKNVVAGGNPCRVLRSI